MMPVISENSDEDKYEELKMPVSSLKEALPLKDLISKLQTEFEIKPKEEEEDKDETVAESCLDFNEIQQFVNLDMIDIDCKDGEDGSPFDRYRRKMFDIREDGLLKKYIVKQGVGPLVPNNSVVYIRYQAYNEYQEVPFDSTMWQCQGEGDLPVPYNLAKNQMIPGLYEAILTMRKGEKAEILVHPDLAYGKFGCPPRIPPDAVILFIVEIDRFVDCGPVLDNQEDLSTYEQREFIKVHKIAKGHYMLANDMFSRGNYNAAANKYRLVINMMHQARIANEEEEKECNHFLVKNYTNACICYKKLKNYKRICIMAADAMRVDEKEVLKSSKLLYFWGYAKMMLGDFNAAKDLLRKSQKLKPQDKDISAALQELEKKKTDALQQERIMMRRAFGNTSSQVTIKEVDEVVEQFRKSVEEELDQFSKNPERDSMFIKDHNLTSQEENIYLDVAKKLGLYARVVDGEKRVIHIKKPADYHN